MLLHEAAAVQDNSLSCNSCQADSAELLNVLDILMSNMRLIDAHKYYY
jgi:hypothetical protein